MYAAASLCALAILYKTVFNNERGQNKMLIFLQNTQIKGILNVIKK